MNDILKIGIIYLLISMPMIYFIDAEFNRKLIVGIIGIIIFTIGYIINEYQCYKWNEG